MRSGECGLNVANKLIMSKGIAGHLEEGAKGEAPVSW